MNSKKRIFVAGHNGMVGSAIAQQLSQDPGLEIVTCSRETLDLTSQNAVQDFFSQRQINQVYLAAAKVGGIWANNTYPADFIYENLMIEANIIHSAYQSNVDRLLFLGSSCIYPKLAPQPIEETSLLTGPLEPTNEPYAIAKIAGIKLCESYNRQYQTDFRSVMPTNLYGPNDNFDPVNSHVLPALMRRFHEAKLSNAESVTVWGTGKPRREFLHVDDMATACIHVMSLDLESFQAKVEERNSHINIGTGIDHSIQEIAHLIAEVTGFEGEILFDTSKPDGTFQKLLNIEKIKGLGWKPQISLPEGLKSTYQWFLTHQESLRT